VACTATSSSGIPGDGAGAAVAPDGAAGFDVSAVFCSAAMAGTTDTQAINTRDENTNRKRRVTLFFPLTPYAGANSDNRGGHPGFLERFHLTQWFSAAISRGLYTPDLSNAKRNQKPLITLLFLTG